MEKRKENRKWKEGWVKCPWCRAGAIIRTWDCLCQGVFPSEYGYDGHETSECMGRQVGFFLMYRRICFNHLQEQKIDCPT